MVNYRNESKPFFGGEWIQWTFEAAHPTIETLDMKVIMYVGSYQTGGQKRVEKHFTEKNMPADLRCSAYPCENGGFDLSAYVSGLAMGRETANKTYRNCKGSIGRSPKGRNPGQQCSVWQVDIDVKITYKA